MGSTGTVPLSDVWDMLEDCAPGYTATETLHHWRVCYGKQVYPTLPLGKHGKRTNVAIQVGQVKQMARQFGILDCAKKHLPQLR